MFAFNMMASGVNAFQAAAPKVDVLHERAKKTVNHVRRAASFSRTRSQSTGPNNDISSQKVEIGRSITIESEDDGPGPVTYRRKITREYSPEDMRGRRDTRRNERRRSPDIDSEASLSPPPRRRIKDAPHNELSDPRDNQLVVRSRSRASGPPSKSPPRSRKSSLPSEPSSEEDLPNSSEDEREEKKKKRAAQVMTGVSAIATVNAAANFWLSVKASHERDQKLKEGKMTAEEARKEKLKNQAQDIASIGAAVLTVKVVRNRWKMTADQKNAAIQHHKERAERRDKRRQRDVEWEFEDLGTESEEEMAIAREQERGRSEMGRARRPGPPQRLLSYSDDEWDRGHRGSHDRYDQYNDRDRRSPPRNRGGNVQGSYASSSHGGSNSGKHHSSKLRKGDSDDESYVENAYYDMGYNAPHPEQDSHHHHHNHRHHSSHRDRRDRAHSVYSYDYRDRYGDHRPSRRSHRSSSRKDKDLPYREGKGDAMMNLGNF